MPVTIKALADGQLPNGINTLYTCPGSTQALAKVIVHYLGGSGTQDVLILVNRTGTSRRVLVVSLNDAESATSPVVTLEAGDTIEGMSTTAAIVDFVINGFEVS